MSTPALPTDQTLQVSSNKNSDRGAIDPANRLVHSLRPMVMGAARFLLREPLMHFVLLGALIFGADAVLHPPPKDDKIITVTKAMRQSFIDNFDEDKSRSPSDAETFDEQERVGFYLTPPTDQMTAQRQLAEIEGQHESEDLQKQTRAILGRPVASLAASFGESFRDALLALPEGQWKVLQSRDGWHVVRLDSRRAGVLASLDNVRDEAVRLWLTDETRKRAWEAVSRLKTAYTIRHEP